jgi:DNA-binding transcriptional LysR family regulator
MVGTFSAAKHIVLAGQGLGVALPFQLRREIDDGACVLLPIEMPWMSLNCASSPNAVDRNSPAAEAFMDNVRQIEKGLPA